MTAQEPPSPTSGEAVTTSANPVYLPCVECNGQGEIPLRQDFAGYWDTKECRCCRGQGEITPARAADWYGQTPDGG
jgi:DnaJ-class molecular chaperone